MRVQTILAIILCFVFAVGAQASPKKSVMYSDDVARLPEAQRKAYSYCISDIQKSYWLGDDVAFRKITTALAKYPRSGELHYMRAMSFSTGGDKQSALRELNSAVKVQPRNTCYLGSRASLLYELARYDDALADCDACLVADYPTDTYLLKAKIYHAKGDRQAEIEQIRFAMYHAAKLGLSLDDVRNQYPAQTAEFPQPVPNNSGSARVIELVKWLASLPTVPTVPEIERRTNTKLTTEFTDAVGPVIFGNDKEFSRLQLMPAHQEPQAFLRVNSDNCTILEEEIKRNFSPFEPASNNPPDGWYEYKTASCTCIFKFYSSGFHALDSIDLAWKKTERGEPANRPAAEEKPDLTPIAERSAQMMRLVKQIDQAGELVSLSQFQSFVHSKFSVIKTSVPSWVAGLSPQARIGRRIGPFQVYYYPEGALKQDFQVEVDPGQWKVSRGQLMTLFGSGQAVPSELKIDQSLDWVSYERPYGSMSCAFSGTDPDEVVRILFWWKEGKPYPSLEKWQSSRHWDALLSAGKTETAKEHYKRAFHLLELSLEKCLGSRVSGKGLETYDQCLLIKQAFIELYRKQHKNAVVDYLEQAPIADVAARFLYIDNGNSPDLPTFKQFAQDYWTVRNSEGSNVYSINRNGVSGVTIQPPSPVWPKCIAYFGKLNNADRQVQTIPVELFDEEYFREW